jgi:hypothetical protein
MKLYVKVESKCIYSERQPKQFGEWSQGYEFNIEGIYSKKTSEAEEFVLDVKKGSTVYALVLIYSQGDSFGTATGLGELIWLFSEYEHAERVYYEYMNNINNDYMHLMLEIDNKEFKRTKIGNTVNGYFENMKSLEIQDFKVL